MWPGYSQPICQLRPSAGMRENRYSRCAPKRPSKSVPAADSKFRTWFHCNKKKGKRYDAARW